MFLRRIAFCTVVSLTTWGLLISGCGSSPESTTTDTTLRVVKPRIPDDVLRQHDLESIFYSDPDLTDNPVQLVELLPDGLFVATEPTVSKKGRLKLLNRKNLLPEWYFPLSYALRSPPSVYRYPETVTDKFNEVYFSQMDTVVCLDLKYGAEIWSAQIPYSIATRVVADEYYYLFGSDNARAYSYRKKSEAEEWPFRTRDTIEASPVVQGNSVFIASRGGSIYKLFGAEPGWILGESWEFETGSRIVADPTLYSRWVIVGSTDYKLYCLETKDGSEFWAFQAEAPIEDKPVVYSYRSNQEYVYCIATQKSRNQEIRTLFSLRLRDGKEAWRSSGIRKVVSMGSRSLYVINDPAPGEGRFLIALDVQTGEERFRIPVDGFDFVPQNSADSGRDLSERGKIFLIARDGTVQVLRERT